MDSHKQNTLGLKKDSENHQYGFHPSCKSMCPGPPRATTGFAQTTHRTWHVVVLAAMIYYRNRTQSKITKQREEAHGQSPEDTRRKLPRAPYCLYNKPPLLENGGTLLRSKVPAMGQPCRKTFVSKDSNLKPECSFFSAIGDSKF